MKMKRLVIPAAIAALLAFSCAKSYNPPTSQLNRERFDAWMKENHPDVAKSAHGIYVLSETEGSGALVGNEENSPYIRIEYTLRNPYTGKISATTRETVAKQIDAYDPSYYYGPVIEYRGDNALYIGFEDIIRTMKVGGSKTAIVPGWLINSKRYDDEEKYIEEFESTDPILYEVSVTDTIHNLDSWERRKMKDYIETSFPGTQAVADTSFHHIIREEGSGEKYGSSGQFKINYTGRLVDGKVFDTTIESVAKDNGIWNKDKTYAPMVVTLADKYTDVKLSESSSSEGSSTIIGFAMALKEMRPGEKCTAIFQSSLGYGSAGSGGSIPAYAPLRFDIEAIVEKKEE